MVDRGADVPKISEEQRAAARQRLIDATVAVIERDGPDGLTTRAIVSEAGVSAGMFYGHFPSKEALLAAVVEHKTDELTMLLDAEIQMGAALEDVARQLIHHLLVHDLRGLSAFRGPTGTEEGNEVQRTINQRIVDAFGPLVHRLTEAGVVRADVDAEALVELIDLVVDGLNRRRAFDGFVSSDDRLVATAMSALEAYLLTTPQEDPS